ncbi:AfsR/SARP family transcriptional regulator [Streptomyces sp. NBC_00690]|uniref:AfsR/SARP family transcriptional regulator n=1 Tax=Streptomyces sp. NBC_00690 TaxID=2975808 RepID=UPI002E2B85EC|nr:AfsR/SARP family transcriptional regulator [Streptomyces sp. NBC_00690]
MEIKILGPISLTCEKETIRIRSFKQRTILALLACSNGAVVSVDRLMDALWQGASPPSAGKNLQVYIWHLRRLLESHGALDRIRYAPPGYQLMLRPGELDLVLFQQHAQEARRAGDRGDHQQAAEYFRKALSIWQGEALADVLSIPALYAESVHLDELRLTVLEEYLAAELALGEYARVISEVTAPIRAHPFREQLRMKQMLALYLSGRQSDALAAYNTLHRELGQELGLEPSAPLQELQRLVLHRSPLLNSALLSHLR